MFKFDFSIDDADEELVQSFAELKPDDDHEKQAVEQQAFREALLVDLLDQLPPRISFSPIHIPGASEDNQTSTILRRDLFDARFQLIAESDEKDEDPSVDSHPTDKSDLEFVEAPSDLVPGVYEGGLKTWECSVDLVSHLDGLKIAAEQWRGKRVLELGCGTAIPSLYVLQKLFSQGNLSESTASETHIHLQDYNESVLRLVTIPNVILAWYNSNASAEFRASASSSDSQDQQKVDSSQSDSDVEISPELKAAFLVSLTKLGINLRFFSGSWETFDLSATGGLYDVLLTSETVYRPDSLPSLVNLMKAALGEHPREESIPRCLVAAKIVYFGVGGGVSEFMDVVTKAGGEVKTVWETHRGVSRSIMQLQWK